MKTETDNLDSVKVGILLRRYFPACMLMVMSVASICVVAYTFSWISPLLVVAGVLAAFLALFAGLVQGHSSRESVLYSARAIPESADPANVLGNPDGSFNLPSLTNIMHEGVVLVKNGRILYANPAFSYILAAQESELIGSRLSSYMHPDDLAALHLDGKTRSPDSAPSRTSMRMTTRLGDVRWVICSVYSINWRREPANLLIFEDIGALKQAQASLEEQEQQSRILFERTPLGIAMFDAMGVLKLSNTSWRTTWSNVVGAGGRRFNIVQDPFMPDQSIERAIRQAFNKQESGISNFEHNTPWGETRWLNITFHPMLTPLDQLIGVAMIQQDITDYVRSARRENELNDQLTALRIEVSQAAAQYSQVIDHSPYVTMAFDGEDVITAWNPAAEKRFSVPKKRAVGLDYKRIGPELVPYAKFLRKKPDASGDIYGIRVERVDEGGLHIERVSVSSMRMAMKNTVVLQIRDITSGVLLLGMHHILGGIAAAASVANYAHNIAEPGLSATSTPEDKKSIACKALAFINTCTLQPAHKVLAVSAFMANFEAEFKEAMPGVVYSVNTEQEDFEISTDPALLNKALINLIKFAGSSTGNSAPAEYAIFQRSDHNYAIINVVCKHANPAELPFKEVWEQAETGRISGFCLNGHEWLGKYPPEALQSIMTIADLQGVLGMYAAPEGGTGIVFRVPRPEFIRSQAQAVKDNA